MEKNKNHEFGSVNSQPQTGKGLPSSSFKQIPAPVDDDKRTIVPSFGPQVKKSITEEMIEPRQPHEALFLVLAYLNLFELLSIIKVCRSLRDAINNDVLLWLDIVVGPPLNFRLNNNILLKITSKAKGRLRTLALMNCEGITDDALEHVMENNLLISKLYVPGCTGLTPDGIVRIVKKLTEHNHNLKHLKLNGLYHTTKEHLETLYTCLKVNPMKQEHLQQPNMFLDYRHFSPLKDEETSHPIDIEVCPKCKDVRLVFDCPRESCMWRRGRPPTECRGCCFCIPRCENCGGCIEFEDLGETVCMDVLCLDCWLRLPKCNHCNKPYCNRHADQNEWSRAVSSGFICDVCPLRTLDG